LAASLRGEADDQAVAELREAWRTPGLAEAIAVEPLTLAARTAWVIARARAVAPANPELASLADEALDVLRTALARRSAAPRKAEDAAADVFLALLRAEPKLPASLVPLLPAAETVCAAPRPAALTAVAASLLRNAPAQAVRFALEQGRVRGDDWT